MTDKTSFLSYSRVDSRFALKLVKDLRAQRQYVWLDQIDIPPGTRFDREIENTLRESRVLLVILSPESVASENVQDEIAFALKNGKQIIPLMHKPCVIPYRIERLQYIDFTSDYQDGLNALSHILAKIPVDQTSVLSDRTRVAGTYPTPELPMQASVSDSKQVSRVRILFAFSIIAVVALAIYLWIKDASNKNNELVSPETSSTFDSAETKKFDTDSVSKAPGVSTAQRQLDTSDLKIPPPSDARNASSKSIVPKGDVKTEKATKRESKFLGSFPLIFTSEDPEFPITCDANGAYAVYKDHVIVTFSSIKFIYLGQDRFPNKFKEERNIEALSMFLVKRTSTSWVGSEESNTIQYKITLQPGEEVLESSKTFKIPITDVESLDGFEFNIRIYSEWAKGSHYNAFSKTLFTLPNN
jgi:hypothetical protein